MKSSARNIEGGFSECRRRNKERLWTEILCKAFLFAKTEPNRKINIYYFHDEDFLSPNSFEVLGLFLFEEERDGVCKLVRRENEKDF